MLLVVVAVVAAALPPTALKKLEDSLGSEDRVAHVSLHGGNDRRCAFAALVVDGDVTEARAQGQATLNARGLGKDARGRACTQTVVVDVRWRERVSSWPAGTPLPVRILSGGLELETDGVVIPCGGADRDLGLVCVRTSQGKNLKGVVDGGALQVQM